MTSKRTSLLMLVIFLFFSTPITMASGNQNLSPIPETSSAEGLSHYSTQYYATYTVKFHYSLTHLGSLPRDYYFKYARLNDRGPDSSLTEYTPEYQESELKSMVITDNYNSLDKGVHDEYDNTFDEIDARLSRGEQLNMTYQYEITVNQINFDTEIEDSEIGAYDESSDRHDLYCDVTEKYFEKNNADLIQFSNQLSGDETNPVDIAQNVYNGVIEHLNYSVQKPERGALWAFTNQEGDCSEYSDLMITLLRIQGIPARKATGLIMSQFGGYAPKEGDLTTFKYDSRTATNSFLGHAWVEYYVPSVGWISCDPTFGEEIDYFNKQDYMRFTNTIGAWFSVPEVDQKVSEFPYYPIFASTAQSSEEYRYSYEATITVKDSKMPPEEEEGSLLDQIPSYPLVIFNISILGTCFGLILVLRKKISMKN